jgi:hypothetical protein
MILKATWMAACLKPDFLQIQYENRYAFSVETAIKSGEMVVFLKQFDF